MGYVVQPSGDIVREQFIYTVDKGPFPFAAGSNPIAHFHRAIFVQGGVMPDYARRQLFEHGPAALAALGRHAFQFQYFTIQNDPARRDAARRIVVLLRRAVDANPNDYNLAASLAGLQRDLGNPQAGRATVDRYAAAHPDDLRIHLLRTRIGTKPSDFDDAARALDAAAASPKNDPEAFYTAGILGYEMVAHGDLPPAPRAMILRDARKLLERAISVKPDYFEAMTYLNLVLREQAAAESDPARHKALMDEADRVRSNAVEIIKRRKP